MEIVNPQAAGIDVGSRSHWVDIPEYTDPCTGDGDPP